MPDNISNNKNNENRTTLSKETSIKEKSRKSIKNTPKKQTSSYQDVPKRRDVKGIPSKKLGVFENQVKDNSLKKEVPNKVKKTSTKVQEKETTSKTKESSQHKKDNIKKDSTGKKKTANNSSTKKNATTKTVSKTSDVKKEQIKTNQKASPSKNITNNSKGTTTKKTAQDPSAKAKTEKKASSTTSNKNNNSTIKQGTTSKKTTKATPKKATTIKKASSVKTNKKDESRPGSREKARPTNRNPKQTSLQNVPIKQNKKARKNKINKTSSKKKSNNYTDDDQLLRLKDFLDKRKYSPESSRIVSRRERTRSVSKKQLTNKEQINKDKRTFSYRLLNYRLNHNLKLLYLIILIIVLISFVSINYFIKDYDLFPKKGNVVEKKIEDFVENNVIVEAITEEKEPSIVIPSSNKVINYDDIKDSNDYVKIIIENGLSATQIATLLEEKGIAAKNDFLNYVIEKDLTSNLRSGEYYINRNSNVEDIVTTIIEFDPSLIKIYPAKTIDEVDNQLANRELIKRGEFNTACINLCKQKGLSFVEGWFAPATYKITNEFDVDLLASTMFDTTISILSPYLKTISENGYSINDIIIIASLIQAETQDINQMPIISSVIHNRLKNDMPLGIDATTRYELGDWTSELTSEQLDKITPYNTRRQKGLIPSGICLSSKDALISAIFPQDTDYLYYIHDENGILITAYTYEEHLANINKRDND